MTKTRGPRRWRTRRYLGPRRKRRLVAWSTFSRLHQWQSRAGVRRKAFRIAPEIGVALCRWRRRAKLYRFRDARKFFSFVMRRDPWESFWIGPKGHRYGR